jgi:hypothetical protein
MLGFDFRQGHRAIDKYTDERDNAASLIQRRIAMAKGQQRGNREAKKPKKEKPKVAATAQVSFRLNPLKSTGAKDDQGKTK